MTDATHRPSAAADTATDAAPGSGTPERDETPRRLEFDDDNGSSRSKWFAAALVVALVGWMGSGYILPSGQEVSAEDTADVPAPVAVAVQDSVAEEVTLYLSSEGQAMPDRSTEVPSETSGEIAEVAVRKGEDVVAGQVIARIDAAQRAADLSRAEAELDRAQRDFDNAETLLARGVATVDRVAETRTALADARAEIAAARQAIKATEIRAPFDGRVERLEVDPGEYVQTGAIVATIVDNTPLTVAIRIPQQALRDLRSGQSAEVTFITGETRTGEVTFVGTSADAETRTFLAEVTVENEDGTIPAGVSAEVRIPTGTEVAHLLSPAIMSLAADGILGIKTLGDGDTVVFNEVEIVRAESKGIWVTGLPDRATVLTVGQGFVSAGEKVTPRPAGDLAEEAVEVANAVGEATDMPAPDDDAPETTGINAFESTER